MCTGPLFSTLLLYFQNMKYFPIFYIFSQIFKYVAFFCSFSEKIARMPLLSSIGPDIYYIYIQFRKVLIPILCNNLYSTEIK